MAKFIPVIYPKSATFEYRKLGFKKSPAFDGGTSIPIIDMILKANCNIINVAEN